MTELTQGKSLFAENLGIKVIEASPGRAAATLEITEQHCNSMGSAHGGAIFTLADHAFGAAQKVTCPDFVSMEMHIRFLRPAKSGQRLTATAQRLHQGRSTAFYQIEVRDETNRLIAHLTGTGHVAGKGTRTG